MGNYVDGCSKEKGCSRSSEFSDAKTFGKRRQEMKREKITKNQYIKLSKARSTGPQSLEETDEERTERSSVASTEGITLYDEVIRAGGAQNLRYFSKQVDLRSIQIICLLGEGSFAKVYLVRKDNYK